MTQRTLRISFLSFLLTLLLLIVTTVGATVQAASFRGVSRAPGDPPVSIEIRLAKGLPNFFPKHVDVKVGVFFEISNHTTAAQSVTYNGSVLVTIQPNADGQIVCNRPNKAVFSLQSNPKAILHLTCT